MCSDAATASQGCAFYSATGIIFMSMVGTMLIKQPFLISGIEDVEKAKESAFGAAGTFFFTFVISVLYMIKEGRRIDRGSSSAIDNNNNNNNNNTNNNNTSSSRRGYSGLSAADQDEFTPYRDDDAAQESHTATTSLNRIDFLDDAFENPLPTGRPYRDDPELI